MICKIKDNGFNLDSRLEMTLFDCKIWLYAKTLYKVVFCPSENLDVKKQYAF